MQSFIDELTRQIREQTRLTAVGIAVDHSAHPLVLSVSGIRRHLSTVPVQRDDKWHIGSITKSITATMVGKLVDDGLLQFDAMLSSLLPDLDTHPAWSECTLEHLLTHTAGLPANFPWKVQKVDPPTIDELVQARHGLIRDVLSKPPRHPCGSAFLYSNVGYTIAGHALEAIMRTDYESLVDQRLFRACSLTSAGFGPPKGDGPDDQPMGHQSLLWYRKAVNPFEGRADNGPVISAAGRAHMNLADLVAYGRLHLDGELGADTFLSKQVWRKLHQPQLNDYACGWVNAIHDWSGSALIWHNGSNTLWYTLLMLIPDKNVVMAFATNEGQVGKAEKAFFAAAKQIVERLD